MKLIQVGCNYYYFCCFTCRSCTSENRRKVSVCWVL